MDVLTREQARRNIVALGLPQFPIEDLIGELRQANLDTSEKDAVWYQSFLKRVEADN